MPAFNRDKLRDIIRTLRDQDIFSLLDDAIEALPDDELARIVGRYFHVEGLYDDGRTSSSWLEDVKAFESASLAGEYYESFDVNSKNCTALSKGTCAWICRCRRLLDRCIAESESGDRAQALAALETIFGLLRRFDAGEDVIFFADEGGSWQVGVDWERVFPAWFACLAATTAPDEYARRVAATVDEFDRANREKHQAAAYRAASPAQRKALRAGQGV